LAQRVWEMQVRVQNRMLVLRVTVAGLLIAGALFAVLPAAADDWETCINSLRSDVAIPVCTRAIASGQYTSQNLATLYTSRGIAYLATGQFDRAKQDFDQTFRLDPQFAQGDRTDPVSVGDGRFIFCCRAMVFDSRIKATCAIKDISSNADDLRCVTACFKKLSGR
jgi:tetratricopeptide (TPR) repeat protein